MTNGEPRYYPPEQPVSDWQQPAYGTMKRSVWPTVIGVTCIVLGALGLLCYGCESGMSVFLATAASNLPPELQNAKPPQPILIGNIVNYCLSFVLSLWLLVGGIALIMRRAGARAALITWSVCKFIVVIGTVVYSIMYLPQLVQHMNQQASQQPNPFFTNMTEPLMLIGLLIQAVMLLIWPVFLLIWFAVPRFRNEVNSWRGASAQDEHPMMYPDDPQQWM